jgi:lysozyme family protein
MSNFDRMFEIVAGHEGCLTAHPADPGNWTDGAVGAGICRGTKFGISAAAYPDLDIANLTLDAAKALYQRDYWQRIAGTVCQPHSLCRCSMRQSTTAVAARFAGCSRLPM